MDLMVSSELFLAVLRSSSPLVIAAMAALLCERSGVIQIALEGFMLVGAFTAAATASYLGGPWGLFVSGSLGVGLGFFYALLVVGLKVDQIISGTIVNMLAWGGLPIVSKVLFDSSAGTPSLALSERLPSWLPIILAILVTIFVFYIIKATPFGMWLTFAGEKPEALTVVGLNPKLLRVFAILICGFLASLAGGCLSVGLSSSYTRNMTAGRGFLALAALILGKWQPLPVAFACLVFGAFDVLQMKLQGTEFAWWGPVPSQLVQIIPYVMTLVLLIGFVGKSRPPKFLGIP
jgi:general nucleoside transport system permease protein